MSQRCAHVAAEVDSSLPGTPTAQDCQTLFFPRLEEIEGHSPACQRMDSFRKAQKFKCKLHS